MYSGKTRHTPCPTGSTSAPRSPPPYKPAATSSRSRHRLHPPQQVHKLFRCMLLSSCHSQLLLFQFYRFSTGTKGAGQASNSHSNRLAQLDRSSSWRWERDGTGMERALRQTIKRSLCELGKARDRWEQRSWHTSSARSDKPLPIEGYPHSLPSMDCLNSAFTNLESGGQ